LTDPKKREVLLHLSREKKLNFKRESIISMFGSFLPSLGWLAPPKFTRAWEPTLL
jgi:hypothetical protein